MIFADVSSGRSERDSSSPTKPEMLGSAAAATVSIGALPPSARRLECRGADGDDALGIEGAHRLDGVAGVNRALERVRRNDFADFGNLHHVEQGRDARHDVLSARRRRRGDGFVRAGERYNERGGRLRQHVLVGRRIGEQDLGDALELGRGFSRGAAIVTGDEDVDLGTDYLGRGQRLVGRVLKRLVVVFGEKKRGHQRVQLAVKLPHQIAPAPLS